MAEPVRKPPTPMESREPHSIRFTPTEWDAIREAAQPRGLEPAVFVRMLTMYALEDVTRTTRVEASLGMPRQMLGGSARTRRFSGVLAAIFAASLLAGCTTVDPSALAAYDRAAALRLVPERIERPYARLNDGAPWTRERRVEISR